MNEPRAETETVLLIDPDPESLDALQRSLEGFKLGVVVASTIEEALTQAESRTPRLVLSELILPDGSGFALCRELRERPSLAQVPILLISRWKSEADRILAFEAGADDFVAKPFFVRELSSRLQAVLRRSVTPQAETSRPTTTASTESLVLDPEQGEARLAGDLLPLTPREFSILRVLARHQGRVLSRSELIEEVWKGDSAPSARSVDAHVKNLRRKLGEARNAVESVRGLGYRLNDRVIHPHEQTESPWRRPADRWP
jgi:DNA-binding response OmpR family regulator